MNVSWLLLIPFLLGAPPVAVHWDRSGDAAISLSVAGIDESMERCLASGFELRYTIQLQLCRRSPLWFDTCDDTRERIHKLRYDPIADLYTIDVDMMRDAKPPQRFSAPTAQEAFTFFSRVRKLPLQALTRRKIEEILGAKRSPYVSVRVRCDCRGERSRAVDAISTILTLGLVSLEHFDTGWADYDLVR